jgi:hypothetical protein
MLRSTVLSPKVISYSILTLNTTLTKAEVNVSDVSKSTGQGTRSNMFELN